jgi:hypothetical protein
MRKMMMLAPVVALALVSANCSGGAFNSPTSPGVGVSDSATEARGGGGKKPGGGSGGTTGGGSLSVVMVNDINGDGLPNWGETITFNVTTSAEKPFVRLQCYQGGSAVYAGSVGYFPGYAWAQEFYLVSGGWSSGAADCTATLYTSTDGSSSTTLATLNFTAGA